MKKSEASHLVTLRGPEVIAFGGLIGPGTYIEHKVKIGGGSFTDGRRLETGLPEFTINDEEDEYNQKFTPATGLYMLKGLTAHEYGHVWFTSFSEFKKFRERMVDKFEAEGIQPMLAAKVTSHMFNITEDGRIEDRMCKKYPGLINYFRFNNGTIWQVDPEEVPTELDDNGDNKREFDNFMRCLITYSVVGLRPRWYKNTKGLRMRDEFEKVAHCIDDAIKAPSCRKNCEVTEKLFEEAWDYIIELLKRLQDNEEELEDYLNNGGGAGLGGDDISEGTEGAESGKGTSAGGESPRIGGGGAGETGDNSGGAGSTIGQEQEVGEYNDTYEMAGEMPGYDYSGVTMDGGGSKKVIRSKAGHVTKTPEQIIEEVTSEGVSTAAKEAAATATSEKKEKKTESSAISREGVERMIGEVGYDKEHVRYFREEKNTYQMRPLPEHLRPAASKFKRKVVRCFKEKNSKITKMTSGKLDMRLLHKVAMDEFNVFQKDLNKSDVDAVVEICWDGSGSMCGGKQNYSGEACAVIEEGLKGLIPLKIINFSVDWSHQEVVHYLVKDFDDKRKDINYSISYTKSKGFNGGNKDGYDIRICTDDLMRRQEKDKILIVMSDGLPSDYNSINPQDDVKDAVKEARKKGIIVIPIFFGDEYFRNSAYDAYEYMYEKFIINSAPEELPDRLVKLFEKIILR